MAGERRLRAEHGCEASLYVVCQGPPRPVGRDQLVDRKRQTKLIVQGHGGQPELVEVDDAQIPPGNHEIIGREIAVLPVTRELAQPGEVLDARVQKPQRSLGKRDAVLRFGRQLGYRSMESQEDIVTTKSGSRDRSRNARNTGFVLSTRMKLRGFSPDRGEISWETSAGSSRIKVFARR